MPTLPAVSRCALALPVPYGLFGVRVVDCAASRRLSSVNRNPERERLRVESGECRISCGADPGFTRNSSVRSWPILYEILTAGIVTGSHTTLTPIAEGSSITQ